MAIARLELQAPDLDRLVELGKAHLDKTADKRLLRELDRSQRRLREVEAEDAKRLAKHRSMARAY